MKNFFAENWFKLIISIAVLIAGISVAYYYLAYRPTSTQSQNIVAVSSSPNEQLPTSTIFTPTSTVQVITNNANTIATPSKKISSPPVTSVSAQNTTQNSTPPPPTNTTTPTNAPSPSVSQPAQTSATATTSNPYFSVYLMGASSNRASSTFDKIAEIYFSAGGNRGYNLGPMTLTFSGDALSANTLSGVQLFDPSGNAVPVRSSGSCPTDGSCAITFDLSGYTVGIGEAGSFILTMDDWDTNLEPTTPPGGQRNISVSIASQNDISTSGGPNPFEYTSFPITVASFSYAPND